MAKRSGWSVLIMTLGLVLQASGARAAFVNFESGHVRPLALSPDGNRLFAVNTPDNRLAIYDITAGGLTLAAEVSVGLEPVAVATRTNGLGRTEAWVTNQLSDSVSVVEVDPLDVTLSRVIRTLLVGDEPRDVVFAGPSGSRAFISCARRGQSRFTANPDTGPQLTTQGVGRADVWAFNSDGTAGVGVGGSISIIQLFSDSPRALAVSNDGLTVFAAAFLSGNRTTSLFQGTVGNGGPPPPPGFTPNPPSVGLIVKFDTATSTWKDERPTSNWNSSVPFSLPDRDVFIINANANPPALAGGTNVVTDVGTVNFNMVVRPGTGNPGRLYVSNLEARNQIRFEPSITGQIDENRVTVINGTTATPHHLNSHINYAFTPGPQSEIDQSLAFPLGMTFSADGNTLFVAGFGSSAIGAFDANVLEAAAPNGPLTKSLVQVGSGPTGLVLDAARDRLYVMNRIAQTISIVGNASLPSRSQTGVVPLRFDPTPQFIRAGRRFLYNAKLTSGHGDQACATCHIFGDFDALAWDLGDPFGSVVNNTNPFRVGSGSPFHPMKGPMTTQSLRGMANNGPMHWRGDRSGGGAQALDEDLAFKAFNPAFVGLLGRGSQLTAQEMQSFTDFILTVVYPPNPIRALNNADTAAQSAGRTFFSNTSTDGPLTCSFCHALPLGADGFSSIEGETQEFKIAHLRNAYQKVGMFFSAGPQVRGFGFLHDGSVATVFDFLHAGVFQFPNGNTDRRNLESLVMAFDTGLRPIVGQQVSVTPLTVNDATVIARIDLMIARDDAGECELTVKGNVAGQARGAVYVGSNNFQPDRNADVVLNKTALRGLAAVAGQEQTYTCTPPGTGVRIGVDRDEDGFFDRTELELGSDPANPLSVPGGQSTTTTSSSTSTTTTSSTTTLPVILVSTRSLTLKDDNVVPIDLAKRKISFKVDTRFDVTHVAPPTPFGPGDPRANGAVLTVYNSAGLTTDSVAVSLPAGSLWTQLGSNTFSGWQYKNPDPNAAITKVQVKADKITVTGGRALWSYTLQESQQGRVAVRLALGSATEWCTDAPAKVSGSPPSTANNDKMDKFVAQSKSPAPATCPALP